MIKAVLFDIDNVLYNSGHQVEMARRAAVEAMVRAGLPLGLEDAFERLNEIVAEKGSNYNKHYDILVGEKDDKYRIIAAGLVAYHNTKKLYVKPYDDTMPTLERLKERGYKVGVVSNGLAIKQWEKLTRLGLSNAFDKVVVSEEVGIWKPEAGVFLKACEGLSVEPEECVYVGDRLDTDILGANRAGMTSVRLLRGKWKEDKPEGLQDRPDFEIRGLDEIIGIMSQ